MAQTISKQVGDTRITKKITDSLLKAKEPAPRRSVYRNLIVPCINRGLTPHGILDTGNEFSLHDALSCEPF
jgi:hypothetical protein